jgi:hypothetical protein
MKPLIVGSVLFCACGLVTAATAELRIENIDWFVTDLDQSDGIAALAAPVQFSAPPHGDRHQSHDPVEGEPDRITTLAQTGEGFAFRLQTFGPAEQVWLTTWTSHRTIEGPPSSYWFQVTPRTSFTVAADADIFVSADARDAAAEAWLGMEVRELNGNQVPGPSPSSTAHSSGPFSLTFSNVTAAPVYLMYSYGVSGSITAAPIPEPSSYALMTLGLAGLAFVARRRLR